MMFHLPRAATRCGAGLLLVGSVVALTLGSAITTGAATIAPPPKDCNTPNQSNGVGVLATPQNTGSNGQPFLTKTLTDTVPGTGSTTYFFDLVTSRAADNDAGGGATVSYTANTLTDTSKAWTANQWVNATVLVGGSITDTVASNTATTLTMSANWSSTPAAQSGYVISFFNELLDCAWDVTQGGNAATANYATQITAPVFRVTDGRLTISIDVNNSDAICDRVQVKGMDRNGVAFTDYSNLVGSPSATTCSVPANLPEAPVGALLLTAGGVGLAAAGITRRRREGRA